MRRISSLRRISSFVGCEIVGISIFASKMSRIVNASIFQRRNLRASKEERNLFFPNVIVYMVHRRMAVDSCAGDLLRRDSPILFDIRRHLFCVKEILYITNANSNVGFQLVDLWCHQY